MHRSTSPRFPRPFVRGVRLALLLGARAAGPAFAAGPPPTTMFRFSPAHTAARGGPSFDVGGRSMAVSALEAKTGEPVWSSDVGARVPGSVAVAGNTAPYGAEDFRVDTLDLTTGLGRSIEVTEGAISSSVVAADGLVLVGSDGRRLYAFKTRPAAAEGRYQSADGQDFTLQVRPGRLAIANGTFPPALAITKADGSFACPMLFGLTGRLRCEPGQPVSALALNLFGQETIALRGDAAEAPRTE